MGCATQRSVEKPAPSEKALAQPFSLPEETTLTKDPFQGFPEKYRQEAVQLERSGEFLKALFYWRVVQRFTPQDPEVSEKVLFWETWLQRTGEKHFLKGLEHFQKNSFHEARKEFLLALTYHPEHEWALDYLKHKLNEPIWISYEVKPGDHLKKIAQEIYNDPEKDFLITYFNQVDHPVLLKPGTVLNLPILPSWLIAKKASPQEIPPKATGPSKPLKLDASLQEQADVHYATGLRYFLSEELEQAIEEWEKSLRINPNHSNAKRDLERARTLLQHLKK